MLPFIVFLACNGSKEPPLSPEEPQSKKQTEIENLKFNAFSIEQWVDDQVLSKVTDDYSYLQTVSQKTLSWDASSKIVPIVRSSQDFKKATASPQYWSTFLWSSDVSEAPIQGTEDSFFGGLFTQYKNISDEGQYVPAFVEKNSGFDSGLYHVKSETDLGVGIVAMATLTRSSAGDLKEIRESGLSLQGKPFPKWPAHPIFQNTNTTYTDIPDTGYTVAMICWGGQHYSQWPNLKWDTEPMVKDLLRDTINIRQGASLTGEQKAQIINKIHARNDLKFNQCQLWALPASNNELDTYFSKPSYLLGDVTKKQGEGFEWMIRSEDPRLKPGDSFTLSVESFKSVLSQKDNRTTAEPEQEIKEEDIGGSRDDTTTPSSPSQTVVEQKVVHQSQRKQCSLPTGSPIYANAKQWLSYLEVDTLLKIEEDGSFSLSDDSVQMPSQKRSLCNDVTIFLTGFSDAARCRPLVHVTSQSNPLLSCVQNLHDTVVTLD